MDNQITSPRKVTVSGALGSGKSAVSKALADRWQCERYYTGRAFRMLAKERGMTVLQINEIAAKDSSIDREVDDIYRHLEDVKADLVVDAHLAWHFMPNSFKVQLQIDPLVAAERVFQDKQRDDRINEQNYENVEEVAQAQLQRRESNRQRWLDLYDVDIDNPDNFDLIIDTSELGIEHIVDIIERQFEAWHSGETITDVAVEQS
ncbi:MAG: AAA family ATPase [Gammaproteobacteria bacterium]|nr:AAA family ATPase [Gammaproteobacteria bacterium]